MDISDELYITATHERENFVKLLEKYGDYATLNLSLKKIEEKYEDNKKIIKDLLLGNIGYEYNKQNALYELPTKELITSIKKLCNVLNITHVEEIMAGCGLLSKLLQQSTELIINPTDGHYSIYTSGMNFCNVQTKDYLEYVLDETNVFNNVTSLLVSWCPYTLYQSIFDEVYTRLKPKVIFMISEFLNSNLIFIKMKSELERINYRVITFPIKTISYRHSCDDRQLRSLMVAIHTSHEIQPTDEELITLLKSECHESYDEDLKSIHILSDLYKIGYGPKWYSLLDEQSVKKLIILLEKIVTHINIHIPEYLSNLDELTFWYNQNLEAKYPIKITTREKFLEYHTLYNKISNSIEFEELKQKKYFPEWVTVKSIGIKFLYLDYSTNEFDKKWKESLNKFNIKYSQMSMPYNLNRLPNLSNISGGVIYAPHELTSTNIESSPIWAELWNDIMGR